MMKKGLLLALILFFMSYLNAQTPATQKIRDYHKTQHIPYLKEYIDFLSIPNTMNDTAALTQNAQYIIQMMKKRGIEGRMLYADTKGAIPAVYGEILTKGATKTLIFYAHYDGQPVNPDKWAQGLSPFTPQLVTNTIDKGGVFTDFNAFTELEKKNDPLSNNWRLYGRASADDKAGVFTILNAYDAIFKSGLKPKINIKFFFEGEEEKGSTNLGEILEKHKALLNADAWVISDGPLPASGRKQVTFGVRGDINMNMTVYGAKRPLHSGNYGNWAPNPALKLVKLLASMKDDDGKVLIDGFYDDVTPLSKTEREALNAIPDPASIMQGELAFAQAEGGGKSFLELITTLPTLNINGIVSANVGRLASNIIPTMATVTLDLRLVKGNDTERQVQKVINHVKKHNYYVLDREPTEEERMKYPNIATIKVGSGYNAQRTSMDLPISQQVIKAVQGSSKEPIVLMPSAGGSLPLFLFEKILKTPPMTVPVVNYDNNQHGENENLRIGCLWDGIETIAAIMLLD